jgi:hypothetical protein
MRIKLKNHLVLYYRILNSIYSSKNMIKKGIRIKKLSYSPQGYIYYGL